MIRGRGGDQGFFGSACFKVYYDIRVLSVLHNMKIKIIITLIALFILGASAWNFVAQNNDDGAVVTDPFAVAVIEDVFNVDTLAAAVADGRSAKCAVKPTADNGNTTATFYISNGKMRGDYSVSGGGVGHMRIFDQTTYTWLEGQATGVKTATVQADQGFNPDQKVGLNCITWFEDTSMFDLPSDIEFRALSQTGETPSIPSVGESFGAADGAGTVKPTAAQCAACDQAPSGYKAKCLATLGCQ